MKPFSDHKPFFRSQINEMLSTRNTLLVFSVDMLCQYIYVMIYLPFVFTRGHVHTADRNRKVSHTVYSGV